jgi:hypothetical protein
MQMTKTGETADLGQILGCGVLYNGTGNPFYLVASHSEPGRVHVVERLSAVRLRCDCRGYQFGGQCRHTRGVEALIQYVERAERCHHEVAKQDVVQRAPTAPGAAASAASREARHADRAARAGHPGDTALLRRSNKPFSLLK